MRVFIEPCAFPDLPRTRLATERQRTTHLPIEQDMIETWLTAGRVLGVSVRTEVVVDGWPFPVLVEQFGSPKGVLPLLVGDDERYSIGSRAGYFVSMISPQSYSAFDRKLFEETLNDWQWFGEGPPPQWYTGEVWG